MARRRETASKSSWTPRPQPPLFGQPLRLQRQLAASGAVMDLAMDIASGIDEVALRRPELPARELFVSGVRIGRSVVGTMTTTLLLAYSGGYLTLLMMFAAQGTPPRDFLNSPLVSAEIVKTLIGSFSLVLVAPFTAAVGARLLRRR